VGTQAGLRILDLGDDGSELLLAEVVPQNWTGGLATLASAFIARYKASR